MIDLAALFSTVQRDGILVAAAAGAQRWRLSTANGDALLDGFDDGACRCLFWRGYGHQDADFLLPGEYGLATAAAGGWLLTAPTDTRPSFWIPCLPTMRRLDDQGRILQEDACTIRAFAAGVQGVMVGLATQTGRVHDLVVWEIAAHAADLRLQLDSLESAEAQPTFLWGSHGTFRIPADLYRHLIHGSVFDLRFSWPHKRRAYSENEAHALHLALRNRELGCGKVLYRYLRNQVLLSVLARQDADGAWRQGIWTAGMECHFRLHCSAMHLLMDCYSERPEAMLLAALDRAAAFIAAQATEAMGETWFLHDSLEQSEEAIGRNIAGWRPCRNPLKAASNTLVLNTHIDTLIALDRYQEIARSHAFDDRLASARRLLRRLLDLKPADWLYGPVFHAIFLTLLPTERARALPLPLRAIKRLAKGYLIPLLPYIKCRLPRLVMPAGYIERALSLASLADSYHSINLMDLVRYLRRFPDDDRIRQVIAGALAFARERALLAHWAEQPSARYAIGFWVEALYQLAQFDPQPKLIGSLVGAVVLAERQGLGLPPSVAGTNLEVLPLAHQVPCPHLADGRLRTLNLARIGGRAYLWVNPTLEAIAFAPPPAAGAVEWIASGVPAATPPATLEPGQWVLEHEISAN